MRIGSLCAITLTLLLGACAAPTPREPLKGHINAETASKPTAGTIPAPVQQTLALPKPKPAPKAETYSVVVNNVPVRDLLFALARDAKVNVDIHPGITGNVTLNAIDQTLPQLLTRIAKQVDMRHELDGPNLAVMPDSPFLKHYKVDYVNIARKVTGTVSTNTQIATSSIVPGATTVPTATGGAGNVSNTSIENTSRNQFLDSLEKNIKDILRETDKILPEGSSETVVEQTSAQTATGAAALPQNSGARAAQAVANALQANPAPGSNSQTVGNAIVRRTTFREAASVIMHPESGVVTVRATQRQHDRIQEFLDRVLNSAKRQVLIEATIVEVALKDNYQQGIDWTEFSSGGLVEIVGNSLASATNLRFTKNTNDPKAIISLLDTFGTTKVLSSPRVSVLNNQTALLKVVENIVYFTVQSKIQAADSGSSIISPTAFRSYTTFPQTVSVGLVLSVTPQISDLDVVTLNVRPTITSLVKMVKDPNPDLTSVVNEVPQLQTREIESIMRVASGNTAILGGLMDDRVEFQNQRIPLAGQTPVIGELFNNRNNAAKKTELVIFLRPVVIRDASLDGDYANMRGYLPDGNFFTAPSEARPFMVDPGR